MNVKYTFCIKQIQLFGNNCRVCVILAVCHNPMDPVLQFLCAIPFKAPVFISQIKGAKDHRNMYHFKAEISFKPIHYAPQVWGFGKLFVHVSSNSYIQLPLILEN